MFLDLGVAILTAVFFDYLFVVNFYLLLFFSLLISLLPDLDYVVFWLQGKHKAKAYKHRNLFHYPLLYLPLGFAIFYLLFNQIYALAFLFISFLHFVHDSIACGRRIRWLFPFTKNFYAFVYMYFGVRRRGIWKLLFVFNKKFLKIFDKKHADKNWLTNIYKKWHPIAVFETTVFIVSLAVLFFHLFFT